MPGQQIPARIENLDCRVKYSRCIDEPLVEVAVQATGRVQIYHHRQALGLAMRNQSKVNNANKAANIMDVNDQTAHEFVTAMGSKLLVHGHTHRPGIHKYASFTRVVLGAWEQCGWLARQTDRQLTLECFTLAARYGI